MLMGEDNSSSAEYEDGDGFDQATYDEFVKSEEKMAKIRAHTADKLEMADILDRYSKAGDF